MEVSMVWKGLHIWCGRGLWRRRVEGFALWEVCVVESRNLFCALDMYQIKISWRNTCLLSSYAALE